MDRCSSRKVARVAAVIVETWGGMVARVDGLHKSILNKCEEAIEVTRTSPQCQITIIWRNAGIVESLGTTNLSAERRGVTQ